MADREHEGMKRCTKCGEWKPATAEFFNRNKTVVVGLRSWCKVCCREYYQKNKDRLLEHKREYRQKNKDMAREYHREYNREYKQKNKDRLREYHREYMREYREKSKDRKREYNREYYQKNKEEIAERYREYEQSPVGRLAKSIKYLRQKTGATIYVRDMTDEQKETLANQYVAIRTLEKTEKELLAASGKKRCSRCDRILDYGRFNKNITTSDGADHWCRECVAERQREYRQQNKDKRKEYDREYYQQNKDKKNEHDREYRQQNKDKIKERKREYYEKNKDKIKDYNREYYEKNKKALDKIESVPDNRV